MVYQILRKDYLAVRLNLFVVLRQVFSSWNILSMVAYDTISFMGRKFWLAVFRLCSRIQQSNWPILKRSSNVSNWEYQYKFIPFLSITMFRAKCSDDLVKKVKEWNYSDSETRKYRAYLPHIQWTHHCQFFKISPSSFFPNF